MWNILQNFKKEDGSIIAALKNEFENNDDFFVADEILWKMSKKDFLKKVFILAEYFKKFDEKNIGILLPNSIFAALVIFALYMAKKTPIMLNWTLWEQGFSHCVEISHCQKIVTSEKFLAKISLDFLKKYENNYIFLENLKQEISLKNVFFGMKNTFLKKFPEIKESEIAVVLFTSGTEKLPKMVKLSHKNILENIFYTLKNMEIRTEDTFLSFLPPFHSFGFTIGAILPFVVGLRTFFTPSPMDSQKINDIIKNENITIITATPTFYKMILDLEKSENLKSLEIVIVGSEKCSEKIFEKSEKLTNAKIVEWYGVTEGSPVISVNLRNLQKMWSVGKILENLECKILDLETEKEKNIWEIGEICVSGSSIFSEELHKSEESPFIEIDGKNFYKTGDLGFLDEDNFLYISGRLKRFIKIWWEMISLSMIENILEKKFGNVAVEAKENGENRKIVVFSREKIDTENMNNFLWENNFPKIIKISEHIMIDDFPLLWSGKIDYKVLKNMISFEEKIEKNYDLSDVEMVLKEKIREIVGNENLEISRESRFGKDIILDSIDASELIIFIRKKYNITKNIEIAKIQTFQDLIDIIL